MDAHNLRYDDKIKFHLLTPSFPLSTQFLQEDYFE